MLKDTMSYLGNKFQSYLFPLVHDTLYEDDLLAKHRRLIAILEIIQIENHMPLKIALTRGRPPKHPIKIARAFIAKHVMNFSTTSQLIYGLKVDRNLRYICGWEPGQPIAAESTFSRIFNMLADSNILEVIHDLLAREVFKDHVVLHSGRDSVPIPAREWPLDENGNKISGRKKKKQGKKKYSSKKNTVCQKQALGDLSAEEMLSFVPKKCDIGRKTNSSGNAFCWRGYKLHLDVAEGWFPLSYVLTSASVHDTQTAIPLSKISSERTPVLYELMDSAYDSKAILNYIENKGRRALISPRIWNGERGLATKRELKAQKTLSWKPSDRRRLQHRMVNERLFARLKDHLSGMSVWVRGYRKVKCHISFAILALAADELLHFLC